MQKVTESEREQENKKKGKIKKKQETDDGSLLQLNF